MPPAQVLHDILLAMAARDSGSGGVGYCQGMDYVCANIMRVMHAEGAAEIGIALAALERMHDAEEEHEAQQDSQAARASQQQQH